MMALSRQKSLLLVAAALTRLALFLGYPSLPDFLTGRVEISTPVTSFKRLQEGLFLYTHNVSPYDGGVFYQAPLLLPLFALIPSTFFSLFTSLLFVAVDLFCAYVLMCIAESSLAGNERLFSSPRKHIKWNSVAIGAAFLFNPLAVASCLGRPTSMFTNLAILLAIQKAIDRQHLNSMIAAAFASYLSLYPILLLPPLCLLCLDQKQRHSKNSVHVGGFLTECALASVGTLAVLIFMSYLVTGASWEFLFSTYGNHLLVADLTPNIGLWWYFLIEMFDSFREFFLGVFWLHLGSYVGGFMVRIRRQPLFVVTALLGILAMFKPYPNISDAALYLSLVPLYRHVFPLMRYSFFAVATLLYAVLLGPAFHYLWIYAGSGNANFFYAITLVWSLGMTVVIADTIWAVLRDEWETERPEMRDKHVRQI